MKALNNFEQAAQIVFRLWREAERHRIEGARSEGYADGLKAAAAVLRRSGGITDETLPELQTGLWEEGAS